jgi:uncharacterized protein (TIGR03437 family)
MPGTGGNWLTVTPLSGATPSTLTLNVTPAGLSDGSYSSQIVLQGPSNSVTIPVGFFVFSPPPPPPPPSSIQLSPSSVSFVLEAGNGPLPIPLVVTLHPSDIAITAKTDSGGNWMSTAVFSNPSQAVIQVNATAVNLSAGTYGGTITVTSGTLAPVQIPVTLTVVAAPTAETTVTATPVSLTLTAPTGQYQTQSFTLDSGGNPVLVGLSWESLGVDEWMQPVNITSSLPVGDGRVATPVTVTVGASAGPLLPGVYRRVITVKWATGSLAIPVTFSVTASSTQPPILSAVVNAASMAPGAIAPGEIISLFGTGLGQVFINGVPAQLTYSSTTQVNVIVPDTVGAQGAATVQVVWNGIASQTWKVPLAASSPGIFTIDGSGLGQAIVRPLNSVTRGSTIQIYATGGGSPAHVTIGGIDAPAQVVTIAPGVQQFSALVPQTVTPGPAVPITLTIGGKTSSGGVTISIQ